MLVVSIAGVMLIVDPLQARMLSNPPSADASPLPRMIDDNLPISIKSKLAGLAFMSVNLLCLGAESVSPPVTQFWYMLTGSVHHAAYQRSSFDRPGHGHRLSCASRYLRRVSH
jgi:hypothetical protein